MPAPERAVFPCNPRGGPTTVVVLAGGESSRMGRDKRLLEIPANSGEPNLLEDTLCRVGRLGLPVVVAAGNSPPPDFEKLHGAPWTTCLDGPGRGPAAGILGAQQALPSHSLLVVACDMPFLSHRLLGRILQLAEQCSADLAVPCASGSATSDHRTKRRAEDLHLHPLAAYYSPRVLHLLRSQVEAGNYGLQRWAKNLCHDGPSRAKVRLLSATDLGFEQTDFQQQLFNCNTPEDFEQAQRLRLLDETPRS